VSNKTGPCGNCGKEIPIERTTCSEKCRKELIKKLKKYLKEFEKKYGIRRDKRKN